MSSSCWSDNLYGSERPQDFKKKFEDPYKPLLDAGVKLYASLATTTAREQRYYKLFNMDGSSITHSRRPYAHRAVFSRSRVRTSIRADSHGSRRNCRRRRTPTGRSRTFITAVLVGRRHGCGHAAPRVLEPLFVRYNVSVVLTGHDHFYERVKPQKGIVYFVVGAGGQLREGNIDKRSGLTEVGNDQEYSFMAAEINGDEMWFNAVDRKGRVFDSGVITRRK